MENPLKTITPIDYIHRLYKFYNKKYGRDPDIEWVYTNVSKRISIDKNKVEEICRQVEANNKPVEIDAEFLKKERFRNLENIKNSLLNNSIITPVKQLATATINIKSSWKLFRLILLLIGMGAMYMSIFYSYEWLKEFLVPWRALLLSSIMIMFAVSAFELILLFRQQRKFMLIMVFGILWAVVTVFSMASTVAGQYNSQMKTLVHKYKSSSETGKQLSKKRNIEEQKKEYKERLSTLRKDSHRLQSSLSAFSTPETIEKNVWIYNSLNVQYRNNRWNIKKLEKLLLKVRNKEDKEQSVKTTPPDFYLWVSSLWNWNPEMLQFWMSVFPAIFIDLVAPISIAIFMFVKD